MCVVCERTKVGSSSSMPSSSSSSSSSLPSSSSSSSLQSLVSSSLEGGDGARRVLMCHRRHNPGRARREILLRPCSGFSGFTVVSDKNNTSSSKSLPKRSTCTSHAGANMQALPAPYIVPIEEFARQSMLCVFCVYLRVYLAGVLVCTATCATALTLSSIAVVICRCVTWRDSQKCLSLLTRAVTPSLTPWVGSTSTESNF